MARWKLERSNPEGEREQINRILIDIEGFIGSLDDDLSGKQPLDATLTALAAANWAANALPIGSGADTVAQVSFAANTFPARASTGNLVAKPITDFGLSLVDDSTAAAARTTLGLADSIYTPTVAGVANISSVTASTNWHYSRLGNVVEVAGRLDIDPVAAAGTLTTATVTLPIPSNLGALHHLVGTGIAAFNPYVPMLVNADVTNDVASVSFYSTGTAAISCWIKFSYLVV